jgi:hypothetical protein
MEGNGGTKHPDRRVTAGVSVGGKQRGHSQGKGFPCAVRSPKSASIHLQDTGIYLHPSCIVRSISRTASVDSSYGRARRVTAKLEQSREED